MENYGAALLFASMILFGAAVFGAVEENEPLMQLGQRASIVTLVLGVALIALSYIIPCGK